MIKVSVYKESDYPLNEEKIEKVITKVCQDHQIDKDFTIDVAIVGDQKMDELVKKYYQEDPEGEWDHPILTFPSNELKEKFVTPDSEVPSLGDMVISYQSAKSRAEEAGKSTEELICDLAEHGTLHLLGIHHEH